MNIEKIRQDFPLLNDWIYLDNAFVGVMPKQVMEGYQEYIDLWYNFSPSGDRTILQEWIAKMNEVRESVADFVHVTSKEIAFSMCTGSCLNIVINGMDWKKGDNTVFPEWEHNPLYTNTLQRNNVEPREIKHNNYRFELADFESVIDDNTKLVQVSEVSFVNGITIDLKELSNIAHEHGAKVLVDSTQAVGAIDVDWKHDDVDFVAVAPYKYLMGPTGLSFLYVKEENIVDLIPDRTGWKNQIWEGDNPEDPTDLTSAEKFEYGTLHFQGMYALGRAIDYLNSVGIKEIEKRNLSTAKYLFDNVKEAGKTTYTPDTPTSPIVSYFQKEGPALAAKLKAKKIKVTGRAAHGEHMRISGHFYNTEADVDTFLAKVKELGY